jgi:hypothetical protein
MDGFSAPDCAAEERAGIEGIARSDIAAVDLGVGRGSPSVVRPVRQRAHASPGRQHRVLVRFSAEEFDAVAAAGLRAGLTPTGYVAESAVASAGGDGGVDAGVSRAELAQVQRDLFAARTVLVSAAASLRAVAAGDAGREVAVCVSAVARLDEVAARLHGLLKRSRS